MRDRHSMIIQIKKFGDTLISRPEGRDAALVIRNQFLINNKEDLVTLDFEGVKIMTPSWLDEILQEIFKTYAKDHVTYENTKNSSVKASLEIILEHKPIEG